MRILRTACVGLCLTLSAPVWADAYQDTIDNFKKSEIGREYFASAYGYAVFPLIGKGGAGIGAAGGKGRVYEGGKLTGESIMGQISVGFQLGGQAYSEVIFFKDKRAYDEFTGGSFEFGADASAVAITAGVAAQAGTKGAAATAGVSAGRTKQAVAEYYKGMAVLTLAKGGLMYEAALAGQRYTFKKL